MKGSSPDAPGVVGDPIPSIDHSDVDGRGRSGQLVVRWFEVADRSGSDRPTGVLRERFAFVRETRQSRPRIVLDGITLRQRGKIVVPKRAFYVLGRRPQPRGYMLAQFRHRRGVGALP